MDTASPPTTLRERDASLYLGISVAWLRLARREGRGPAYVRIGRAIRYRLIDLDAWLVANRVKTRAS